MSEGERERERGSVRREMKRRRKEKWADGRRAAIYVGKKPVPLCVPCPCEVRKGPPFVDVPLLPLWEHPLGLAREGAQWQKVPPSFVGDVYSSERGQRTTNEDNDTARTSQPVVLSWRRPKQAPDLSQRKEVGGTAEV